MNKEKEALAKEGIGAAADEVLQDAGQAGQGSSEDGSGGGGNSDAGGGSRSVGGDQAGAAGGGFGPDGGADDPAQSVQGCSDTEKVARQLCEAATTEKDPFLRAALWDEYNQYKKILARQ
jgi:hypothetical protein